MKYNFKEIGSRIQKARKNTFHSQDKFLEELSKNELPPIDPDMLLEESDLDEILAQQPKEEEKND